MPFPVPTSSGRQRVIIHHLSDLHYQQEVRGKDNSLVQYSGYLERLEPSRRPDLIVITGDLTSSGTKGELSTVAEILRHNFPAWAADLSDHIFVVPGPRDFNWEGTDPQGLNTFYAAFADFGLPSAAHAVPLSGTTVRSALNAVAYPIDTCYSLADCREEMKAQFHEYGNTYEQFVRQYRRAGRGISGIFGRHDNKAELVDLRERYLDLAEANDLTLVDAGRVQEGDLKAFKDWINAEGYSQRPQGAVSEPLKILVTHHPLAVQQDQIEASKRAKRNGTPFEQLAKDAGKAGFHLALHGHIHKPQVLSDLSLLQDAEVQHPLRQVGAGSLGDGGTFNEITATYVSEEQNQQNHWRLEIRTINLKAQNPHDAATFVLLNRTEDAAKHAEELEREKRRREDFDFRVHAVMRQYSEAVYHATPTINPDKPGTIQLPQLAMQGIESIIRDIIFPGFGLRVRLFLRDVQYSRDNRAIPKLNAAYLNPPPGDGTGLVAYPMSLAGLSLLLRRTVKYPKELDTSLTDDDDQWLKRSGRDIKLIEVLKKLLEETLATSYPGPQEAERVQVVLDKFSQGAAQQLMVRDFYRQPTSSSVSRPIPSSFASLFQNVWRTASSPTCPRSPSSWSA